MTLDASPRPIMISGGAPTPHHQLGRAPCTGPGSRGARCAAASSIPSPTMRHIVLSLLLLPAVACAPTTDRASATPTDSAAIAAGAVAVEGDTAADDTQPKPADGPPRVCTAAQLTASRLGGDAGAGQRGVTYALRNHGHVPCLIGGVPALVLLDSAGAPMPEPRAVPSEADFPDATTARSPLVLAPGDSAAFQITFAGISAGTLTCRQATALRIVPPGAIDTLTLADTLQPCGPTLRVIPVLRRIPPVASR